MARRSGEGHNSGPYCRQEFSAFRTGCHCAAPVAARCHITCTAEYKTRSQDDQRANPEANWPDRSARCDLKRVPWRPDRVVRVEDRACFKRALHPLHRRYVAGECACRNSCPRTKLASSRLARRTSGGGEVRHHPHPALRRTAAALRDCARAGEQPEARGATSAS
jgi:hypothetical protein